MSTVEDENSLLFLRISAGKIDNLKTRNIALILTPFRSTEVFKD